MANGTSKIVSIPVHVSSSTMKFQSISVINPLDSIWREFLVSGSSPGTIRYPFSSRRQEQNPVQTTTTTRKAANILLAIILLPFCIERLDREDLSKSPSKFTQIISPSCSISSFVVANEVAKRMTVLPSGSFSQKPKRHFSPIFAICSSFNMINC